MSSSILKVNNIKVEQFARYSRPAEHSDAVGKRSLASFLNTIDTYGVQVQNNFEVEFSGIDGISFFVTNFSLPGSKQNTCDLHYDGIKITVPVNYECDHEFSMTFINDAKGFVYSLLKAYIEYDSYNHYTLPTQSITIKALTGQIRNCDTDSSGTTKKYQGKLGSPLAGDAGEGDTIAYCGSSIKCYGVRLTSISGLEYGYSNNDVQTFTVQGTMVEYSHLPGTLTKISFFGQTLYKQ